MRTPLLVVAAAALALVGLAGCSASSPAVPTKVADLTTKPEVGTRHVENPFVDRLRGGGDDASATLRDIREVAPDRALAVWEYSASDDEEHATTKLALINTEKGTTVWTRGWTGGSSVQPQTRYGAPIVVLEGGDDSGRTTLYAVRLSDGKTVSATTATVAAIGSGGVGAVPLDRIVLETKHGLSLYATDDLKKPLWKEPLSGHPQIIGTSGGHLFTSKAVYSLSTGEKQEWKGDLGSDVGYLPTDAIWPGKKPGVLQYEGDSESGAIDRLDPNDGSSVWHLAIPKPQQGLAYDRDGVLVVNKGTLTKYNGETGEKMWSRHGVGAVASLSQTFPTAVGITDLDLVRAGSHSDAFTVVDPATGRKRFSLSVEGSNDDSPLIIGASEHMLYVTHRDPDGHALYAYDIATGRERWRIAKIYSNWYDFRILGGRLVAASVGLSLSRNDLVQFGKHPALLGIG